MDSETRTALIELWRDVPGTKPHMLRVDAANKHPTYRANDIITWPSGAATDDATAEALARDAIVCWLPQQANVDSVSLLYATEPNDASTSVSIRTFSDGTRRPKPDTLVFDDPSLLRNLIAAARAVHKGDERGE